MIKIISDLKKTMTSEKRESAKHDWFAYFIGRPLSYVLTVPFYQLKIKPNVVSMISLIEVVIAATVLGTSTTKIQAYIGITLFFLWNLLDGVDGNLARITGLKSKLGSTWDAASGYAAMALMYFSMGLYTSNINGNSLFITLGSITALATMYPRLVMHKSKSDETATVKTDTLSDRRKFGIVKILALNVTSATGLVQPLMLISVILNQTILFVIFYLLVNVMVMALSLKQIFKGTL